MKLAAAARRHLPIAIGASALVLGGVLASAGSAGAADHGSQIQNYPLKQVDIGQAGVSGVRDGQDEIAHQSIGQKDIGPGGVSGSADGTGSEIKKGSIVKKDLSKGVQAQLGGGPPGDTSGYKVYARPRPVPDGQLITLTNMCPNGKSAVGGGYMSDQRLTVLGSAPTNDGSGWDLRIKNDSGTTAHVIQKVACASMS